MIYIAPSYLKELLTPYNPSRTLRSANKGLLIQPKFCLKSYGYRAFSLWNALPDQLIKDMQLAYFILSQS